MWAWVLSALIVLLVWGAWFALRAAMAFPLWIPAAVTALVALLLIGRLVFRRVRAARAARALERAIAQQAEEQARAAKPERAAEIRELHRQIERGIASLKASKLGAGKRGEGALYALPWYALVGPPGAGKTTALRHSGLVFPFLDPEGGGVRGVGGTRNCAFWFTNEAILLDTAGRYTTEADDHDEWVAFLEQLLKYRADKPLNGVIVAISVSELLDAPDDQVDRNGQKIRARIDEMQRVLKMILPVYVLFTKADLIAGFSEFFGDLKKSERTGPWGATIPLSGDRSEPGKIFDAEFDTLVERLHARSIQKLASSRAGDAEKIYQFPLEFAAIKRNLSAFIATAFAPAPGDAPPILRGFYFTSGVQEGRPMERVVGAMGRAFGLRPAVEDEVPAEKTESKSFFLRDVFMEVIFPDKDIAARTEAEIRRLFLLRALAAAAVFALALLLLIPSIRSFGKNRAFVAETRDISREAAAVDWTSHERPPTENVGKLDPLLERTRLLDEYRDRPPVGMTFFMYQGDKLHGPVLAQYISSLQRGLVWPTREALARRVRDIRPGNYTEDFDTLKTYLLLGEEHRHRIADDPQLAAWETERLTRAWAQELRERHDLGGVPEEALRARLAPHVAYYVDLLKRGEIAPEKLDDPIISRAREILRSIGDRRVQYAQLVDVLIPLKYDESGPSTRDNLKYPPITLDDLLQGEARARIHSKAQQHGGRPAEVQGPYTAKGHQQVLASLQDGARILEREMWVVPLGSDELLQSAKIQKTLERIREDYDNEYVRQWKDFFRDIEVDTPTSNKDAIGEFEVLAMPEWPYQRLLRALADNTQFIERSPPGDGDPAQGDLVDKARRKVESSLKGGALGAVLPGAAGERRDPVTEKFRAMVRFGVPAPQPKPKDGEPLPPPPPVELDTYVSKLRDLAGEMHNIDEGPANVDTKKATEAFEDAVKTTEGLLLKMDETGRDLMAPLLMDPLKQAYKALIRHAGGAGVGLWEKLVYPAYRDQIKERYPFDLSSNSDASFPDTVAFLKPKDGVLWGFYEQYLKPFHIKQGHKFLPDGHLGARSAPPFNANLRNCLERMDEITDALFPDGGDKPRIDFQINLKTVSPIVSEVIFEVDGQSWRYRNEKEFWHSVTWPGPKPSGAKIQIRGASGLYEEIPREGPWGIFRLFEAGTVTADKESDQVFLVTWEIAAPPVSVTMEVKPSRSQHPFASSFFRATNCPPRIGSAAGKR